MAMQTAQESCETKASLNGYRADRQSTCADWRENTRVYLTIENIATLYPCDSNASWMFLAILRLSSSGIRCCRSSSQRPIVSSATVDPEGSVMIVTVIRLLPSRYTKVFPPTSTVKPSSLLILFRNQPPRLNILPSCRQIDNRSTVVSQ